MQADRTDEDLRVLQQFGLDTVVVRSQSLGNAGGMSGAGIWRVELGVERLCLRRWPAEHPTLERLEWIHTQMSRAALAGCEFVPPLRRARDGSTVVRHAGHLWELSSWQPGVADFHERPSSAKLNAALEGLARFHLATSRSSSDRPGPSPGLGDRWRQLDRLTVDSVQRLRQQINSSRGTEIASLATMILDHLPRCLNCSREVVSEAQTLSTPLQPCLRDVWHDHLLFEGDRLTGLVDFGAMRVETIAGDITRLLGSLVRDDRQSWQAGLRAYQTIHRISLEQHRQLAAFDAANITLAGLNWIRWLYVEDRRFEDRRRVVGRMREISGRTEQMAKQVWPFATEL